MNEVQKRLISEPIQVEGWDGTFRFRLPSPYDELAILSRQQQLLGGLDPMSAGEGARILSFVLASLETLIHESPEGFSLHNLREGENKKLRELHAALEDWREGFRQTVRGEQETVGEGDSSSE
jgi:hypothetical protein